MKILVLADYQADFLSHTVLTGLWEMDGVEIYEMPIMESVRGRVDEGYDLPDGTRGMTGCTGYLQPNPLPEQKHTVTEIADLGFNAFDLIVALSTRDYVKQSLRLLTQNWGDISSKLVVCDGEDSQWVDKELLHDYNPVVFFKRELYRDRPISDYRKMYGRPTMPLQFGAFLRSLPKIDDSVKHIDFFTSLGRTNPIRDKFLSAALDMSDKIPAYCWLATNSDSPLVTQHRLGDTLRDLLSWPEYMAMQGQSKVGVSLVGFGNDCLHSWELFSFATFALYQNTGLHIPYPFKDGVHCRYIIEDDFGSLNSIVEELLNNHAYRQGVAKAGRDHCRRFHSTQARAKYLVDISIKIIGGEKIEIGEYGL